MARTLDINEMTNLTYIGLMTCVSYCKCNICTHGLGITASGVKPREYVTVAAAPSIPFGTWLLIEGIGWRRVEDRGAKITEGKIDLFMKHHADAKRFGVQELRVWR